MKEIVLNERESEVLTVLNKALALGLSVEERESSYGIEKIFSVIKRRKWRKKKFHDFGIPALVFLNLCRRKSSAEIWHGVPKIRPEKIGYFLGVAKRINDRKDNFFDEEYLIRVTVKQSPVL